jgi:hypothetical protein
MRKLFILMLLAGLLLAVMAPSLAQNTDRDGDTVADDVDQCPDLFAEAGGLEGSGCPQGPDFDTDSDGVSDSQDICPTLPAADGGQDGTGCPPEVFAESLPAEIMEATPTFTPTAAGSTPLPTATAHIYGPYFEGYPPCAGSLEPMLAVGDQGQIAERFSTLRTYPAGPVIRVVPAPETFTVIDGPVCAGYGPLTWYHIRYDDPALGEGWASESQVYSIYGRNLYWLELAATAQPTATYTPIPSATPAS